MADLDRPDRQSAKSELALAGEKSAGIDREVFSIRDLAKECGVTARTLRYYEEKGLLSPRREGLERLYSRRDRVRLKYVLMGKCVGFSLEEVREMLDLYDLGDGQATQLRVAVTKFQDRIDRLERQKADIERVLDGLRQASASVAAMLEDREPGVKPRVRMKAARQQSNGSP